MSHKGFDSNHLEYDGAQAALVPSWLRAKKYNWGPAILLNNSNEYDRMYDAQGLVRIGANITNAIHGVCGSLPVNG